MTRVLLTGGSGFIAGHILDTLLKKGHSVVTTVRTQEKADQIRAAYPDVPADKLSFAIVEDIGKEDAFNNAILSTPPFEAVIHTASPFHWNAKDVEKEFLQPAIVGTTSILKAIKRSAPSVKRVVITSSFAAIVDFTKPKGHKFSERDWNPMTREQAFANPRMAYFASKALAERAAWEFMESERPTFSLATIQAPYAFGPINVHLQTLASINTSNEFIRDAVIGRWKDGAPDLPPGLWVDVRDVADAHVVAMEKSEAGGERFFTVAGHWDVNDLIDALRETIELPTVQDGLPTGKKQSLVKGMDFDNDKSKSLLGIKYRSFTDGIKDTAQSILEAQSQEKQQE